MKLSILLQFATFVAFLSGAYSTENQLRTRKLTSKKCKDFNTIVYRDIIPTILSGTELMSAVLEVGPSTSTNMWFLPFKTSLQVNDALVAFLLVSFSDCNDVDFIGEVLQDSLGTLVTLAGKVESKLDGPLLDDMSREEKQTLTEVANDRVDLSCEYSRILEDCFDSYSPQIDLDLEFFDLTTVQFFLARSEGRKKTFKLRKCRD